MEGVRDGTEKHGTGRASADQELVVTPPPCGLPVLKEASGIFTLRGRDRELTESDSRSGRTYSVMLCLPPLYPARGTCTSYCNRARSLEAVPHNSPTTSHTRILVGVCSLSLGIRPRPLENTKLTLLSKNLKVLKSSNSLLVAM